jgi:hypothetical protein
VGEGSAAAAGQLELRCGQIRGQFKQVQVRFGGRSAGQGSGDTWHLESVVAAGIGRLRRPGGS